MSDIYSLMNRGMKLRTGPDGSLYYDGQEIVPPRPSIKPRQTTFSENMVDLFSKIIPQRSAENLFGGRLYPKGDALMRFTGSSGLANMTPITAGILSAGQAAKDVSRGDYGSAAANTAFSLLDAAGSGTVLRNAYRSARQSPELVELTQSPQSRKYFSNMLEEAQDTQGPLGLQVDVYPPEGYKNKTMIASPYGDAGFAITPEGEIVSLVKNKKSKIKGFASKALNYDKKNGVFLNAFDTELTKLYAQSGFRPVSRTSFDEDLFRSEIGDEAVDAFMTANKNFNQGKPDVVFMVRDPDYQGPFANQFGGRRTDYLSAQNDLLREVERLGYKDK